MMKKLRDWICYGFQTKRDTISIEQTSSLVPKSPFSCQKLPCLNQLKKKKTTFLICVKYCFGVLVSAERFKNQKNQYLKTKLKFIFAYCDCTLLKTKIKSLKKKKPLGINKAERSMQNKYIQIPKSFFSQVRIMKKHLNHSIIYILIRELHVLFNVDKSVKLYKYQKDNIREHQWRYKQLSLKVMINQKDFYLIQSIYRLGTIQLKI